MWSHCGLHLHSPDDYGGCTFSSLPLYIIGVCFREMPVQALFAFLFVCLATLENNSLFSFGITSFFF